MKNIGQMMKQIQGMQSQMTEMQAALERLEMTGQSGGGMVSVTLSGKGEMRGVKIDPKLLDPAEVEVLEDLILAAATNAGPELLSSVDQTEADGYATWVMGNQKVLAQAREGLALPSMIPLPSGSVDDAEKHLAVLSSEKGLARLFIAEGRGFELAGKPDQAARSYLDAVKLGGALMQGGLMIDQLVAMACAGVGMKGLEAVKGKLTSADCRLVANEITKINQAYPSADAVLKRDRMVYERRASITIRIAAKIQRLLPNSGLNRALTSFRGKVATNHQALEKLAKEFANRASELEAKPAN